ncbi:unnamed protein product [Prorocentrum cordatum]|uniref:Uncharacterized protein n=1 Tax=Prorocentrum cordatum TaxID=2364126 RepID=A0ABN9WPA1_9DINO|nr:unnamed protein product [Polarella glacialis]|mmetsp:Transcript_33284/g.95118  ORF Transcript_33284/g.95118 Transcript_33284/m.95118 type:complete len:137 (-) Transcript_33284:25-435(-)
MLASHPLRRFNFKSTAELGLLVQRFGRTDKYGRELPDTGLPAVDCATDKQMPLASVRLEPSPAGAATAPRRLQRSSRSSGRSQSLTRCGHVTGTLEGCRPRQQLVPLDARPEDCLAECACRAPPAQPAAGLEQSAL